MRDPLNFESILQQSTLSEFEFIQMWNLRPQSYREAVALIPSLKLTTSEEEVNKIISEM